MNQLQTMGPEVVGQRALFDYGALDQETQVLVRLRAGEIKSLAKRVAADIVEIGGKLGEVKDRVGGNGKFNEWLSAELGWSERTAYNFIAVWQRFSAANFALENVATSALYLLAAPSTPAEAVEVARQIADSGEEVTHGVAKEIVRQAKAKKPKQAELIEQPEEDGAGEAVAPSAICLCGCKAGDHVRNGRYKECTKCECEFFQQATESEIAERRADEKALGISDHTPAAERLTEPEISVKPADVKTPATSKRPAAWFKSRIEINITLMPCEGPGAQRKVLHSVRAGDDTPFVGMSTDEADSLDMLLPMKTCELLAKLTESLAKRPAAKASAKPTVKSKPAAKRTAAKSKSKAKGGKK
ncbi:MAG TPA: DUF3102 domain-containing protein [Blastocatellia bacterium]|nr:DUF3102 domain-containing protein [Blastocatellia bacterium]